MLKKRTKYIDKRGLEIGTTGSDNRLYLALPGRFSNCGEFPIEYVTVENVDWELTIYNYLGEKWRHIVSLKPSEERYLEELFVEKLDLSSEN